MPRKKKPDEMLSSKHHLMRRRKKPVFKKQGELGIAPTSTLLSPFLLPLFFVQILHSECRTLLKKGEEQNVKISCSKFESKSLHDKTENLHTQNEYAGIEGATLDVAPFFRISLCFWLLGLSGIVA